MTFAPARQLTPQAEEGDPTLRPTTLFAALFCAAAIAATATPALAADNGGTPSNSAGGTSSQFDPGQITGGGAPTTPDTVTPQDPSQPVTPPVAAHTAVLHGGVAVAPSDAPLAVKLAIAAANHIRHKPYVWGGGHASFKARGYDCSGSVSYVLHAAGLLSFPEVSGALAHWGVKGEGKWITVYANAGHAFMIIAGLRFDTSGAGQNGPRWRTDSRWFRGFHRRHPAGL
jgi:cell wall-associated NlpC family hydrolase